MLIYKRNVHTKNESSILYRGRVNHVSPKTKHTDRHTSIQTDISVYRVASLLKRRAPTIPTQQGQTVYIAVSYQYISFLYREPHQGRVWLFFYILYFTIIMHCGHKSKNGVVILVLKKIAELIVIE